MDCGSAACMQTSYQNRLVVIFTVYVKKTYIYIYIYTKLCERRCRGSKPSVQRRIKRRSHYKISGLL